MFNLTPQLIVSVACVLTLTACGSGRYNTRSYDSNATSRSTPTAPIAPSPIMRSEVIVAPAAPAATPAQGGVIKSKAGLIREEDLKEYAGLSLSLHDLSPSPGGPVVSAVPSGNHTTAQLRAGDVILSLAGTQIPNACALYRRLRELQPRTLANIEILRGNAMMRGTILLSSERRVIGCG